MKRAIVKTRDNYVIINMRKLQDAVFDKCNVNFLVSKAQYNYLELDLFANTENNNIKIKEFVKLEKYIKSAFPKNTQTEILTKNYKITILFKYVLCIV